MRNLKLALRTLTKTPFVTAIAALSLGLGIGANSAIYSIFHTLLRQDLPVQQPSRLVTLAAPGPESGSYSCGLAGSCDRVFSLPMFRDLEKALALLPLNPSPRSLACASTGRSLRSPVEAQGIA